MLLRNFRDKDVGIEALWT